MSRTHKALLAGLGLAAALESAHAQETEQAPGIAALEDIQQGAGPVSPVQNRFFLKSKRFEITPMVGLAPNNAFASRFSASLALGYHFNEIVSLQLMASYLPDLGKGDVKSLVPILLQQAPSGGDFRQPLEKETLFTQLGVVWSPVYGKINVLGETVLNFDFYGFLGLGFVLQNEYYATENKQFNPETQPQSEFFNLSEPTTEVRAAPTVGLGANFFITQTVALKLDGRFGLVIDDKPVYDPADPPTGSRVTTLLNASVGVAFFFPKMKPRLYDF